MLLNCSDLKQAKPDWLLQPIFKWYSVLWATI